MEQIDIMQARKERILAYIRSDEYIPMKRKDLRVMMDVPVEDRPAFEELLQQLRDIAAEYAGNYSQMGEYPAWEYKEDSKLRDTMVEVYRNMYGKEAEVVAIHAGLECGLFLEKYPELEMVSFGPTLRGVHSPDERLEIATVPKFWDLLCEVLRRI